MRLRVGDGGHLGTWWWEGAPGDAGRGWGAPEDADDKRPLIWQPAHCPHPPPHPPPRQETGCNGVMIGRAAVQDPFIFHRIKVPATCMRTCNTQHMNTSTHSATHKHGHSLSAMAQTHSHSQAWAWAHTVTHSYTQAWAHNHSHTQAWTQSHTQAWAHTQKDTEARALTQCHAQAWAHTTMPHILTCRPALPRAVLRL